MKASVYANPFERTDLIDDNVIIISISPLPKLKADGRLVKATAKAILINKLYSSGIRVANVIYSDGTRDDGVWVNVKDIK